MANETIRFIGGAATAAQVTKFTVGGTVEADDIFILTVTGLDGKTYALSVIAGSTTPATVAGTIATAWNASANALLTPITASTSGDDVVLTADVAGVGFNVAASTTETGGGAADAQTFAENLTGKLHPGGSSDWNTPANWSVGLVPGYDTGQNVYLEDAVVLYGLNQSAIANAIKLHTRGTQLGTNPADGCLPVYLRIKYTTADIAESFGPGVKVEKTPILLDSCSEASTATIHDTTVNTDSALPSVWIKTNNSAAKVIVRRGIVGIGWGDGETSKLNAVDILYRENKTSDAKVYIGDGVIFDGTTPAINKQGGWAMVRSAVATINANAGTLQTEGSGAIADLVIAAGATVIANSTGAITNPVIGGVLDTLQSSAPRTITNPHIHAGGTFKWNKTAVTLTNPITFDESVAITVQAA